MRNKSLILFLLCWIMQLSLSARSDSTTLAKTSPISTFFSNNKEDRLARMEKLFAAVSSDTVSRKVVAFSPNFSDKYRSDDDFNYKQIAAGKTFIARLLERLGKLLKSLFGIGYNTKVTSVTIVVFKILCALIVLVVIYLIIRVLMNHKGNWFFQKKNESLPIDINNTEQLIQSADFEQLISEIEKQGDTRQSIRLYYLWLLKDLKESELIVWLPEKTNADYLSELKQEALRKQFSYLSYLYNYIWYGEFSITDEDYLAAKNAFLIYLRKGYRNG